MKILFLAVMFGVCGMASAATGQLVYEAASSSITYATVSLSSSTPTLISKSTTTTQVSGQVPISWYSITLFNVSASTAVYGFSGSTGAGPVPTLTCANGIPLGAGTPTSPWNQTEQFFGFYMWGMSCVNGSAIDIKTVHRGR